MSTSVNYKRQVILNFFLFVTAILVVITIIFLENNGLPLNVRQSGDNGASIYTMGRSRNHPINDGVPNFFHRTKSARHASSETRHLFDRNISVPDAASNKNGTASSAILSVREALRNTSLATSNDHKTNAESLTVLNVGYFEGARFRWNYPYLFQPPESPRKCQCPGKDGVSQEVIVTLEKNASRTGDFDILFIPRDCSTSRDKNTVWETILSVAPPNQRRIYATFEGAHKLKYQTPMKSPFRNKMFHWSWTHHSNSDFPMPYGFFSYNPSKIRNVMGKNWAEGKTGLVAWMSSWTATSWRRVEFVSFLQKHLKIDLFGQRYKECPRNSKKCEQMLRRYKFYLALENSCCGEYVTEKFWRTLSWDIVPIVFGANRSDYDRLAPPNSFIYADDYNSVQEFADYVNFLNRNDGEYNKYFSWKSQGDIVVNYPPILGTVVKNNVPPETFFYSCKAVCRVTEKYNKERYVNISRFFDPNNDWWCGSCKRCGQHEWIRDFSG